MIFSAARLIAEMRNKLYGSLMKQDLTYFDAQKSGELVNRLANDCWTVGEALTQNISDGLRSFLSTTLGVGMMVSRHNESVKFDTVTFKGQL